MAANNMSDITVQRGFGVHSGHAQAVVVQRLHVSGSETRGSSSLESERREYEQGGESSLEADNHS